MLIEFRFKNYRSFRDEAIMSMEAMGLGSKKDCLIHYKSQKILPTVAIYGKNGGGKSNVIRAFWLAVQFIKNAQRTQHEQYKVLVWIFCDTAEDFRRTPISCTKRAKGNCFSSRRTKF